MNEEEKKAHDEAVAKATAANKARNDDRLAKINAIADANDEGRSADFDDLDEAELKERKAREEDEEAARRLQAEGVDVETETEVTGDTKVINGETYYLQVVNGQEKWQTLKQIRETAAKIEAADDYLQKAAEAVRNTARRDLSKQDEPASLEKDEMRKLLAAVALGDEEAIEKLASALSTRPSPQDVVGVIDQRLSFRTELAQLQEKSKDLLENPYTSRLFNLRLQEMKEENPNMGLKEAYTSIDKELRSAFPNMAKTSTQTKLERKRTLVNVPTAASRQMEAEDEEGEEDLGKAIEQMAKARGLTPHVHSRRN